jgi:hypothetical protein
MHHVQLSYVHSSLQLRDEWAAQPHPSLLPIHGGRSTYHRPLCRLASPAPLPRVARFTDRDIAPQVGILHSACREVTFRQQAPPSSPPGPRACSLELPIDGAPLHWPQRLVAPAGPGQHGPSGGRHERGCLEGDAREGEMPSGRAWQRY